MREALSGTDAPSHAWSHGERSELDWIAATLRSYSPEPLRITSGVSAEGRPWFAAVTEPDGEALLHLSRVGHRYVLRSVGQVYVTDRQDLRTLLLRALQRRPARARAHVLHGAAPWWLAAEAGLYTGSPDPVVPPTVGRVEEEAGSPVRGRRVHEGGSCVPPGVAAAASAGPSMAARAASPMLAGTLVIPAALQTGPTINLGLMADLGTGLLTDPSHTSRSAAGARETGVVPAFIDNGAASDPAQDLGPPSEQARPAPTAPAQVWVAPLPMIGHSMVEGHAALPTAGTHAFLPPTGASSLVAAAGEPTSGPEHATGVAEHAAEPDAVPEAEQTAAASTGAETGEASAGDTGTGAMEPTGFGDGDTLEGGTPNDLSSGSPSTSGDPGAQPSPVELEQVAAQLDPMAPSPQSSDDGGGDLAGGDDGGDDLAGGEDGGGQESDGDLAGGDGQDDLGGGDGQDDLGAGDGEDQLAGEDTGGTGTDGGTDEGGAEDIGNADEGGGSVDEAGDDVAPALDPGADPGPDVPDDPLLPDLSGHAGDHADDEDGGSGHAGSPGSFGRGNFASRLGLDEDDADRGRGSPPSQGSGHASHDVEHGQAADHGLHHATLLDFILY